MAIKDILLALTTYPDRTSGASVADAVAIAAALDARLAAMACEVRVRLPGTLFGNALIDLPAIAASEAKKSANHASQLLATFEEEARKQGVASEVISEACFTMEIAGLFVEYARMRDLTILPGLSGDDLDQGYAEALIFESGRPVLVIPQDPKWRKPFRLDTAVIAWDFSKPAARAVADAIPLLQKMKTVCLVTVANEKTIDTRRSAAELAKHLAHHGLQVTVDTVDGEGRSISDAIEAYCASRGADLLVMGAYGHSRLRQFILGGATRNILSQPKLPVLMSH
jgi:nucleotide-binding universal stress UspA family protein